jgi:hypothetical protein
MRSAADILEALHGNKQAALHDKVALAYVHAQRAEALLNNCDAPPTLLALAQLVLGIVVDDKIPALIESLRADPESENQQ